MRVGALFREALASARASLVPSLLVLLVCAGVSVSVVTTAGRSVAAADAAFRSLTRIDARTLTVVDSTSQGFITPAAVATITTGSTLERAVGLAAPIDAWNGAIGVGGNHVPLWQMQGKMSEIGRLIRGRLPRAHEALITPQAQRILGLADPVGYVITTQGTQFAVVGLIQPEPPYDDLAGGLIAPVTSHAPLREIRVVISSITLASSAQATVLAILSPRDISGVEVDSPVAQAQTAQALSQQFVAYGRSMVLGALAIGFALILAVVLADVLMRRRDLGRRRTLGITRGDLVLLVVLRTLLPAAAGSLVGTLAGDGIVVAVWGTSIPVTFAVGVGIMTVIAALVATLAPAWFAAVRDPVAVMRTP